jgi:hypothetical protein
VRQCRVLIEEWLPTAGDWRGVYSGTVNRTTAIRQERQEAFVWTGRPGPVGSSRFLQTEMCVAVKRTIKRSRVKALFARPTPLKKLCSRYVPVVGVFVDSIVFGVL